jgi:uncharacterized protein with GYD domain
MPTYATLIKYRSQEPNAIREPKKAFEEGIRLASHIGVKSICAYAILGPYDVMIIYEAPSDKAATGMSMATAGKWGAHSETWTLVPMEEFEEITEELADSTEA